jgi:alpha-D-ribose 1-methylphosphonate 5-triphosphate synthase subunit PhnG
MTGSSSAGELPGFMPVNDLMEIDFPGLDSTGGFQTRPYNFAAICSGDLLLAMPPDSHLTILTHAPAEAVKLFADDIIPHLGEIAVLQNRTGLVMLPYTDTAKGARFHLGEVLVSEAQVRIENGVEGYALCTGRDLLQALAIALLDAALRANVQTELIHEFVRVQAEQQGQADDKLLRQVEATRVEMETF